MHGGFLFSDQPLSVHLFAPGKTGASLILSLNAKGENAVDDVLPIRNTETDVLLDARP